MENETRRHTAECAFCGCALLMQARLVRCEQCVAEHQACNDCAEGLVPWEEGFALAA